MTQGLGVGGVAVFLLEEEEVKDGDEERKEAERGRGVGEESRRCGGGRKGNKDGKEGEKEEEELLLFNFPPFSGGGARTGGD